MVKNEADIIEASIRHNIRFLDLIVVIENGSIDGTRDILVDLINEGLPLLLFDDPSFSFFQSEKISEVYRRVAPIYQPEFVFFLDADEFIKAHSRMELEGILKNLGVGEVGLLGWETHIPKSGGNVGDFKFDPVRGMPWRRKMEEPMYTKAVFRRDPALDNDVLVESGNHNVRLRNGSRLTANMLVDVKLLHFPVRSVEQITSKVINGWLALLLESTVTGKREQAYQWKNLYNQILFGRGIDLSDLQDIAFNYAQSNKGNACLDDGIVYDPFEPAYEKLKYLNRTESSVLAKIALGVESYVKNLKVSPISASMFGCGVRVDFAAVKYVIRLLGCRSLYIHGDSSIWSKVIFNSDLSVRKASLCEAELIFFPENFFSDVKRSVGNVCLEGAEAVVCWLPDGFASFEMSDFLNLWRGFGFVPDMRLTMSLRALACYTSVRRGGLVMKKANLYETPKVQAVSDLLCYLPAQSNVWCEPEAKLITNPLENLEIA